MREDSVRFHVDLFHSGVVGVLPLVAVDVLAAADRMTMPSELELACEELTSEFGAGSLSGDSVRYLASGAAKDVYRLDRYPGLVLAVSRSVKQNPIVDGQHRARGECHV